MPLAGTTLPVTGETCDGRASNPRPFVLLPVQPLVLCEAFCGEQVNELVLVRIIQVVAAVTEDEYPYALVLFLFRGMFASRNAGRERSQACEQDGRRYCMVYVVNLVHLLGLIRRCRTGSADKIEYLFLL
jgi:hypothetical protein